MKKLLLVILSMGSLSEMNAQTFTAGTIYPQYTDINPDKLLGYVYWPYTYDAIDMDMFGDTAKDLQVFAQGAVSSGGSAAILALKTLNPNITVAFGRLDSAWDASSTSWVITKIAKPLNMGDAINAPGVVWEDSLIYLEDHSGASGWSKNVDDWLNGDRYVGLRYMNGTGAWYGWLRVNCFSEDSMYVKDYSTATATSAVHEIAGSDLMIYPNPAGQIFYLDGIDPASFRNSNLVMTDLTGRAVTVSCEQSGNRIRIVPAPLAAGCYIVRYSDGESTVAQTILISGE